MASNDTHVWVTTKTMTPARSMPLEREYAKSQSDLYDIDEKHAVRDERTGFLLPQVVHTDLGEVPARASGSARRTTSRNKRIPTDPTATVAASTTTGGISGTSGGTATTTTGTGTTGAATTA